MKVVKIISTLLKSGRRELKALVNGKLDVQTTFESMPFGTDAAPLEKTRAIYTVTDDNGTKVILGYVNTNQKAAPGEHKIYAVDENNVEKAFIHLKNSGDIEIDSAGNKVLLKQDGTIEILGTGDFLARFSAIESAYNDLQTQWNAFASAYVPGGPASVGLPPTAAQSTGDISAAKINELKIPS